MCTEACWAQQLRKLRQAQHPISIHIVLRHDLLHLSNKKWQKTHGKSCGRAPHCCSGSLWQWDLGPAKKHTNSVRPMAKLAMLRCSFSCPSWSVSKYLEPQVWWRWNLENGWEWCILKPNGWHMLASKCFVALSYVKLPQGTGRCNAIRQVDPAQLEHVCALGSDIDIWYVYIYIIYTLHLESHLYILWIITQINSNNTFGCCINMLCSETRYMYLVIDKVHLMKKMRSWKHTVELRWKRDLQF